MEIRVHNICYITITKICCGYCGQIQTASLKIEPNQKYTCSNCHGTLPVELNETHKNLNQYRSTENSDTD